MICNIAIKNVAQARELSSYAANFEFDTFVHGMSTMVDAKSILGLISLVGAKNLCYVVPDDVDSKRAMRGIAKFAT